MLIQLGLRLLISLKKSLDERSGAAGRLIIKVSFHLFNDIAVVIR